MESMLREIDSEDRRCECAKKQSAATMDADQGIGCMPMIGFVPMDGTCR